MNQIPKENEPITIDMLAVMINQGFLDAHKDLIDVTSSLKKELEDKIDNLESKMNLRFEETERKMDFRFNGIQNQLDNIYLNYTQRMEHTQLKERVRKVERKVGIVSV